jgi:XRE family transcriptional regulator, fatty acid utilization regulator
MSDNRDGAVVLGARIRHFRTEASMTLDDLGTALGMSASRLSLIENGRREPRVSELPALAEALGVRVADLLRDEAPNDRAALELELGRAQRSPLYRGLRLPSVRPSKGMQTDALEALVGLHRELARRASESVATPEEARRGNTEQRARMREVDNHLPEIERIAEECVAAVGHTSGALTHREVSRMAEQMGFELMYVDDLPRSARSVTDLANGRIYLPPASIPGGHGLRSMALQAIAHRILGHKPPTSYADFLQQRLEINYFAACCLMPEAQAVAFLGAARDAKDLAVEDFRDAFGVTHEAAALRMTNLMTRHFGMRVHFLRVGDDGAVYKAYENDDLPLPVDVTGAVEGQTVCRRWGARIAADRRNRTTEHYQYTDTPAGTFWCSTQTGSTPDGGFSITFGAPFDDAKWFRGRETTNRQESTCPAEGCCHRPAHELEERWAGQAWPSARLHAHILSPLPTGRFPGVDEAEVYAFLEQHAG